MPRGSAPGHPPWFKATWGSDVTTAGLPASWVEQRLAFHAEPAAGEAAFAGLGLVQGKNGPCGVLAALNAHLVAHRLHGGAPLDPGCQPAAADVARALAALMLPAAGAGADVSVATWATPGGSGTDVVFTAVPQSGLDAFLLEHMDDFTGRGGILLVVYTAVQTRGAELVEKDLRETGTAGQPLIFGPFSLCTSELLSLLLRGSADGNVSCYGPQGGAKITWAERSPLVGLLSMQEVEHRLPVADGLKRPRAAVWIVHGGDHFTFLFSADGQPKRGRRCCCCATSRPGGLAGQSRFRLKCTDAVDLSFFFPSSSLAGWLTRAITIAGKHDQRDGAGAADASSGASTDEAPADQEFSLFHYNGLPPNVSERSACAAGCAAEAWGHCASCVCSRCPPAVSVDRSNKLGVLTHGPPVQGPRCCRVQVVSAGQAPLAPASHSEGVKKFHTPIPGMVWDVVQAKQADKAARPDEWGTWEFEVVLALDDPDHALYGQGETCVAAPHAPVRLQRSASRPPHAACA